MNLTYIKIKDDQEAWILDQVFPAEIHKKLKSLCNNAQLSISPWPAATAFQDRPRYIYEKSDSDWQDIDVFLRSADFIAPFEEASKCKLSYSTADIWADLTGFGSLLPHKEEGGAYMMQTYITDVSHEWSGTTFYNDDQQILFQLPYRDNFGWFFHGQKVMHGRHHDVPESMKRFSLQVWFSIV